MGKVLRLILLTFFLELYLLLIRLIVLVKKLRIYSVKLGSGQKSQKLPAKIKSLFYGSVVRGVLSYKAALKLISEFEISLIRIRKLLLTDYRRKVSRVLAMSLA